MIRIPPTHLVLVCALLVAAPLRAAPAAPAGKPAPARPAGKSAPAMPAGKSAAAKPRRDATATATAPAARAVGSPGSAASASRRLDDVRIEGELEVPRVTFITVRKPHRFTDFTRATGVRSSRRMAAEAKLPAWIPPPTGPTTEAQKESR